MVSEIQELLRGGNSTNINEREIRSDSQKLLIASILDKNSQTEKLKGQKKKTREQQRVSHWFNFGLFKESGYDSVPENREKRTL